MYALMPGRTLGEIEQLADELVGLLGPCMRRDVLLPGEMVEAAERAHQLTAGLTLEDLQADRLRSESLLWNFTVLGEAAAQLSDALKERLPGMSWQQPARPRNRIVHGYWSIDLEILLTTATGQLPAFAASLRTVLDNLTAEADQASPAADHQAPLPGNPPTPAPTHNFEHEIIHYRSPTRCA